VAELVGVEPRVERGVVRPPHPPAEVSAGGDSLTWVSAPDAAAGVAFGSAAGAAVASDEGVSVDLLTETYRKHYPTLLRLAALLLDDPHSCEDVVQEAFVRVHVARHRLREPDKTLAYLRQTVVNLSRSTLRRRLMALRLMPRPTADEPAAEEGAHSVLERDALVRVLRDLPRRQREVIVLRYYADLTEVQVADLLGLSVGSVKAYGSRGLEALRARMETS
jgi:RNA polymerase sigma-70 factor (sigma-E family)